MKLSRITGVPITSEQAIIGVDFGEDLDGNDNAWLLVYDRDKFADPMAMLVAAAPKDYESFLEWMLTGGWEELGFVSYALMDFPTLEVRE